MEKPLEPQKPKTTAARHLRPGQYPQGLKRGRTPLPLTPKYIEFCRYVARGFTIVDSARFAGFSRALAYQIMAREAVASEIVEQRKKVRADAEAKADELASKHRCFVLEDFKHIARTIKSEAQKVRHNRNGMEAAGLVQPQGVRITANAGAQVNSTTLAGSTFRERYKALWLIQKELELGQKLESETAPPRQLIDGTPPPQDPQTSV